MYGCVDYVCVLHTYTVLQCMDGWMYSGSYNIFVHLMVKI